MYYASRAGFNSPGLESIVPSCVAHYQAACANSYGGVYKQVWRSLVINPSISIVDDPESTMPIYLGGYLTATASDPSFVGEYGAAGSYFSFNGSQFLTYSGFDLNTKLVGFAKDWHKTTGGKDFTVMLDLHYISNAATQTLFSTKASGNFAGISAYITGADALTLTQRGDSAAVTVTGPGLTTANDYVVSVAHSHAANLTELAVMTNGTATTSTAGSTFNTTVAACTTPLLFGITLDSLLTSGSFPFANGVKLYGIAIFNTYLSASERLAARTFMIARR